MTCPACNSTEAITVQDGHAKCPCGARWNPEETTLNSLD